LSLDIAMFYNNYDDLHALERRNDLIIQGDGYLLVPDLFVNAVQSQTYGFEVATNWQAMDWWRLQLAYSYLRMKFQNKPGYSELIPVFQEGSQPHHQISLRSSFDIRHDLEFDLWLYYVDEIPELIIGTLAHTASVDAYFQRECPPRLAATQGFGAVTDGYQSTGAVTYRIRTGNLFIPRAGGAWYLWPDKMVILASFKIHQNPF
jgi:hypothetical protein